MIVHLEIKECLLCSLQFQKYQTGIFKYFCRLLSHYYRTQCIKIQELVPRNFTWAEPSILLATESEIIKRSKTIANSISKQFLSVYLANCLRYCDVQRFRDRSEISLNSRINSGVPFWWWCPLETIETPRQYTSNHADGTLSGNIKKSIWDDP